MATAVFGRAKPSSSASITGSAKTQGVMGQSPLPKATQLEWTGAEWFHVAAATYSDAVNQATARS